MSDDAIVAALRANDYRQVLRADKLSNGAVFPSLRATITVPGGEIWRVLAMAFAVDVDAGATNAYVPGVNVTNGVVPVFGLSSNAQVAPGTSSSFSFVNGLTSIAPGVAPDQGIWTAAFPPIPLLPGHQLTVAADLNGQSDPASSVGPVTVYRFVSLLGDHSAPLHSPTADQLAAFLWDAVREH